MKLRREGSGASIEEVPEYARPRFELLVSSQDSNLHSLEAQFGAAVVDDTSRAAELRMQREAYLRQKLATAAEFQLTPQVLADDRQAAGFDVQRSVSFEPASPMPFSPLSSIVEAPHNVSPAQ